MLLKRQPRAQGPTIVMLVSGEAASMIRTHYHNIQVTIFKTGISILSRNKVHIIFVDA